MAEVMELGKSAAAGRQADNDENPGAQFGATTEVVEQFGPAIGQATQFA